MSQAQGPATVQTADSAEAEPQPATGAIAWLFGLGHGHYAQFLNFQDCCPSDQAHRAHWIGLEYDSAGDLLGRMPFMPRGLRLRRLVGRERV